MAFKQPEQFFQLKASTLQISIWACCNDFLIYTQYVLFQSYSDYIKKGHRFLCSLSDSYCTTTPRLRRYAFNSLISMMLK